MRPWWTAVAAAVALLAACPVLAKAFAIERTNRALMHALLGGSVHGPKDARWIADAQLSGRSAEAMAEAAERYRRTASQWNWQGQARTEGVLALALGNRLDAARAFASADDLLSRFWSAKVAAADKRYDEAARLLGRDYPTVLGLLLEKASAAGARGDTAEASVSLEIGARGPVDDRDASTLITRGHLRQVVGAYDSALNDFNRALALCPDCYQAYLYRGQTLSAQGFVTQDAVERDLRRAVTLAPQERDAALTWAQWLLSVQRWREAELAFQAWNERYPDELESVWNLAFIYCHTGRPQEGRSLMRRFLDRSGAAKTEIDRITQLVAQCSG
jgi:tetratricopeptide (TPR) repeat protein